MTTIRPRHLVLFLFSCCLAASFGVLADGTETLGSPSIGIEPGTGIASGGTGLHVQPGSITVTGISGDVVQALLYWNGFHSGAPDDTILVNGTNISGSQIGGTTTFFGTTQSTTYRADITQLLEDQGLLPLGEGVTELSVELDGLDFGAGARDIANGASLILITDDGSASADVELVDGQDLAYARFATPLDTTVEQTFSFDASLVDRPATLTLVAGSVQGPVSNGGILRPNVLLITFNPGGETDDRDNLFFSNVGDEWDHHVLDVTIPAGATSMTVQAVSAGFCSDDVNTPCLADGDCGGVCNIERPNEPKPASFVWIFGALDRAGPAIDIRKQVEGSDSRTFASGSDVVFTIVVTNTGGVDLNNLQTIDPLSPDCDRNPAPSFTLGVGDSVSYTCTAFNVTEGFTNEICVTGVGAGTIVRDCDPSTVRIPSIDIRKEAEGFDSRDFPAGSDVTFTIVVTNTGDVPLDHLQVTDALAPDCDAFPPPGVWLPPGASASYECTVENVTESFTNEACVTALSRDSFQVPVSDCDTSRVEVPECDLSVVKTCFVPMAPPTDNCQGKIVAMTLEYTAEGCDGTTNFQDGKVDCQGGADSGDSPTSIRVTDNRGDRIYAMESDVAIGDSIEVLASMAGEEDLENETVITIGNGIETLKFHTSCSKPVNVGDQFGSVRVTSITTTDGGTVSLEEPGPPTAECTVPAPPPGPHCDGDLTEIGFTYQGGDCFETTNDQENKVECTGDADTEPVRIVVRKGDDIFLDTGTADASYGDVVLATSANADKNDFPSETYVEIYDEFGNLIQELKIHTSCSKELNLGDRFGGVEVFSLAFKDGVSFSLGATVEYTYTITNDSSDDVVDVTVEDSKLGTVPGSPIASIAAGGGTAVLEASAVITEDTSNVVTVRGTLSSGEECVARASAMVTVEEPPPGPQVCDDKIAALLLEYTGPEISGPVEVSIAGEKHRNDPVVYVLDGLQPGTVLSLPGENNFTVDASVHEEDELGSKTTLTINGVTETIHTSCSVPVVAGAPAPLDDPKGDPSSNWLVVTFREKQ